MKIKDDFISVIIPLYNKGKLIIDTIESILAQSHQHFEIIIVNDGSTDKSIEYVTPYTADSRVTLITQVNSGPGSARNTGVQKAKYSMSR